MTVHTDPASHLRDAELMRLLDGEATPAENTRTASHLAACRECAGAVERLRADAAVVSSWLDRAGFEESLPQVARDGDRAVPVAWSDVHRDRGGKGRRGRAAVQSDEGRRGRATPMRPAALAVHAWHTAAPTLRVALIIALLATPVAAIPSLRERVADAIADLRAPASTTAAPTAADAAAATVWFEPAPGEFTVLIDQPQAGGTLRLEPAPSAEAVLRISGESGAGPVVSATTLHIRNLPQTRASYTLQVPAGVTSVTVRIGDRVAAVLDESAFGRGAEVPLH